MGKRPLSQVIVRPYLTLNALAHKRLTGHHPRANLSEKVGWSPSTQREYRPGRPRIYFQDINIVALHSKLHSSNRALRPRHLARLAYQLFLRIRRGV